jgi:peptidoglycan/LPS O-acetylase OafA/YrhL
MPHSRIAVLDAFRALAIVAVLFYHLGFLAELEFATPLSGVAGLFMRIFSYGWLGVEFFFMISGFVIFMTLARVSGPVDFAVRRFARLYPGYLVSAGLVYLVTTLIAYAPNQHSAYDLLIAPLVDAPFFHAAYVSGAYWSLVAEARFYFWICVVYTLFPGKFEIAWSLFCIIGYAAVLTLAPAYSDVVGGEYLPFFTLGIAFYKIFDGKFDRWVAVLLLVAGLGITLFWSEENHDCNPAIMLLIILSFVGLFALFLDKRIDFIATRPLLFLGRISYALYLVHLEIGISLIYWLRLHHVPGLLADAVALLAVIALAQMISMSVEDKGKRAVMAWFAQLNGTPARVPPVAGAE